MGEKEYLSLEEVADMLGVTYQLVYKLARSGELPAVRLGKLYRVSRDDLAAYLEEKKREAGGGGVCSVCGETYRSRLSLKHTCQHDGCEGRDQHGDERRAQAFKRDARLLVGARVGGLREPPDHPHETGASSLDPV